MTSIVIGVGNRDRGDDAVGPIVCDRLQYRLGQSTAVQTFVCEGSILELGLRWESDDHVVIVDAMQSGAAPGHVAAFDATVEPLPTPGAVSTHEIDVSVAVELARAIGRMPAQLLLIGVEAAQTEWGTPPSPAVDTAIDSVVDDLIDEFVDEPVAPGQPAANVAN